MSDISATWPLYKSTDGTTWTDSTQTYDGLYSDAWDECISLQGSDPDGAQYQPQGIYEIGVVLGDGSLGPPDPPIENFTGVPSEAGAYMITLAENSDPYHNYGCWLIAAPS